MQEWYGIYGKPYNGSEPAFFQAEGFDWAKFVEENSETIIGEMNSLIQHHTNLLQPYFDGNLQSASTNWKTIGFYFWGKKNHNICRLFPKTNSILNRIPGLVSASFNCLEPQSLIKPHFGDTNAVFRCHLGIDIPDSLPQCGFTVKGVSRGWEKGKLLIFLDAYTHSAFNQTQYPRYILLMDVVRPEFLSRKKRVCAKVLAMLSLYFISAKLPFIQNTVKRFPPLLIDVFLMPLIWLWYLYLPVQNTINFKFFEQLKVKHHNKS